MNCSFLGGKNYTNMNSTNKSKRSNSLSLVALGAMITCTAALTGCTSAPERTQAEKDKEDKTQGYSSSSSTSYFHTGSSSGVHSTPGGSTVTRGAFGSYGSSAG